MSFKIMYYSYKGGTGKTSALLNTAYALAEKGHRVGVVDFDFDSPGIKNWLSLDTATSDIMQMVRHQLRLEDGLVEHVQEKQLGQHKIWCLPCSGDEELNDAINYNGGTVAYMRDLLDNLCNHEAFNLDYILLDTRSGASVQSAVVFSEVHYTVVNCRLDRQNRVGLPDWFRLCRENDKKFCAVAHAVPVGYANVGLFRAEFQKLLQGTEELFEVPYSPLLYFDETVATMAAASDLSLVPVRDAYAKLTDCIVRGVNP